ncbi:MAG: hypothetical protein FWH28_07250 [Clostridiales bacterium]|nr:hypothetical protein [Clostridiales bacterium]
MITLSPSYLNTLSDGEHSIEIIFTDGSVKTWFAILAASTPGGNDQGDDDQGGNQGDNNQGGNNQGGNNQNGNQGGTIIIDQDDPPLSALPEELLNTIDDAHTVAPDPARPGYYFELDESGTPLGEWHKDETGSTWIYDESAPLSALPKTSQNALTGQRFTVILALALLIILPAVQIRRKKRIS